MSTKTTIQYCAICERENKPSSSNKADRTYSALEVTSMTEKANARYKYGNLPSKRNDDFFIQVTEPQWLRRGNLKKSDFVCKRHLAILMRGVDRGSEGGCCSPLHRGARLCRPGSLKTLPPTWRKKFMNHPKIKENDKDTMMFCWDCYKRHMDRMSKYGDPMGRILGSRDGGIRRTKSLAGTEETTKNLAQAMKRYKSMDKLDSEDKLSPDHSVRRRSSTSSASPRFKTSLLQTEPNTSTEIRSFPSKRSHRGRRSNKGRRSPSPPDNISPVRTSVVHSKRKSSPHKSPKSITTISQVNSSADGSNLDSTLAQAEQFSTSLRHSAELSTAKLNSVRLRVDEGTLTDADSPRDPPVPPPGLFTLKLEPSDDLFGEFCGRSLRSDDTKGSAPESSAKHENSATRDHPTLANRAMKVPAEHEAISPSLQLSDPVLNDIQYGVALLTQADREITFESVMIQGLQTSQQTDESPTGAEEINAIFANQNRDDDSVHQSAGATHVEMNDIHMPTVTGSGEIPGEVLAVYNGTEEKYQSESSDSSSDKTGETQIELEAYISPKQGFYKEQMPDLESGGEKDINKSKDIDTLKCTSAVEKMDIHAASKDTKSPISLKNFTKSVFASGSPRDDAEKISSPSESSQTYAFPTQSSRRLDPVKLQYTGDTRDREEHISLAPRFTIREQSHPLRNHLCVKVPRNCATLPRGQASSFMRVRAEDVEMYPDLMSFLDGITQTVGEELTMYAQDGPRIAKIDLNIVKNKAAHNTTQFTDDILVLRRGKSFEVSIELGEAYDPGRHKILVELALGDSPRVSNGTHLQLPVQPSDYASCDTRLGGQWLARCTGAMDGRVQITVTSPFTGAIGRYKLYFQVEKEGSRSRWQCWREDQRSFILLFNPWGIDDAVYMSSQADRLEYVVADAACIYSGNRLHLIPVPCIYGQYEPGILDACIEMIERSELSSTKRGNPAVVTKAICQHLADSDTTDRSKRFRNAPNVVGPTSILQNYANTGGLQISNDNKVLSLLLVTVYRCLGLPSRVVTCLNYAADTDLPMTVNAHYSEEGQQLDYLNNDKIWPSYTWAGVWMSRVDLPPGFGGWQAILLSTDRKNAIGPIPAYGIKKGRTSSYGGAQEQFVALNANKKHWIVYQDGSMNLFKTEKNVAGSMVVTKSVGSLEPQDITKLYKFPEGCEKHKLAIHEASMHCGYQCDYDEVTRGKEIVMNLKTDPSVIGFGNDVNVVTRITNKSDSVRRVTVQLDGLVLANDGTAEIKVPRETIYVDVMATETVGTTVKLNLASCLHKLTDEHQLLLTAFGTIEGAEKEHVTASHLAGIKQPTIEIQLHGEFKVGGEVTVVSRLKNPLQHSLKESRIELITTGMTPVDIRSTQRKSVGPWQVFKCERVFRCQRAGRHTVVAHFTSDLLSGPRGTQEIDIT